MLDDIRVRRYFAGQLNQILPALPKHASRPQDRDLTMALKLFGDQRFQLQLSFFVVCRWPAFGRLRDNGGRDVAGDDCSADMYESRNAFLTAGLCKIAERL